MGRPNLDVIKARLTDLVDILAYVQELEVERDAARSQTAEDVGRMQRVVYDELVSAVRAALPSADVSAIDGAGSDGDEFEFTAAEVSIACGMLTDALEEVRAERDRLARTLACERGEWAPKGWTCAEVGTPDQWTRPWGEERTALVRRVRGRRWRWQTSGWEPATVGYAPTALDAIEAADAAIKETS